IHLEPLFLEGNLPSTAYKVVKEQEYKGEITVGLTFTPEVITVFLPKHKEKGKSVGLLKMIQLSITLLQVSKSC
ncbi:hypothetical protein P3X46_034034, partial [Hevea brasiliensis]